MAIRNAEATWTGNLKEGSGTMALGSGAFKGAFSYFTRFEEEPGTNPEELVGAALTGCFSMFLSAQLSNAGYPPTKINTSAKVHLGRDDVGPAITLIELETNAVVPGIDTTTFDEIAAKSKAGCPVSKALTGAKITLNASLTS